MGGGRCAYAALSVLRTGRRCRPRGGAHAAGRRSIGRKKAGVRAAAGCGCKEKNLVIRPCRRKEKNMSKSPCESCTRAVDPGQCEDKTCVRWRKWYMQRWALIHGFYKQHRKAGRL